MIKYDFETQIWAVSRHSSNRMLVAHSMDTSVAKATSSAIVASKRGEHVATALKVLHPPEDMADDPTEGLAADGRPQRFGWYRAKVRGHDDLLLVLLDPDSALVLVSYGSSLDVANRSDIEHWAERVSSTEAVQTLGSP